VACSVQRLRVQLNKIVQCEAAMDATREAVNLRRTLAAKYPDACLPDLATSLDSLALRLTETGDHDAANAASREAAEIRSTLQAKTPRRDDERGSA
jgi:hypothetical protein